ncbi:VCBS repeat-containing protein [Pedobacter sp. MR2016-19]|uniref:FG-GAP-like repeat-containing protein n=1 Tax=Pedobacter sp. MR2016-19 TaxID=2780089 RepID=UPI001876881A|nr:FG-GAP-like repeat-containing protein [Pedobacter sp. MR2016-19]MBE5318055.1 VCBS repeat-containing protein [Pedobacter sp. MR2016-19]
MNKRFLFLVALLFAGINVFGQTQPVISSFSPRNGQTGSSVTISGLRFSSVLANNTVFFGDVKATVTAATATAITATVPAGASNKPITVTVNRLMASSTKPFRVTYPVTYGTFTNNAFLLSSNVAPSTDYYLQGSSMATGDFDGDGRIDLVSSNEFGGSALVFKNTGDPKQPFLPTHTIKQTPNITINDIVTGDVNGDGKLDIVMIAGSAVRIYLNTGNAGSFNFATTAVSVSFNNEWGMLNLADIDGDGKLDICINGGSGLSMIRNTSTATAMSFAAPQSISLPNYANNVIIQDMDGDLKPDIVFGYAKKFGILWNISTIGTIAFSARVEFDKTEYTRFTVADVDGDDKADVIVSETNGISVHKNLGTVGNMTFAAPQAIAADVTGTLSTGDLNGDGKPEIIISNEFKKFQVLCNTSTGGTISFAAGDICYSNSYLGKLVIADWNNDGRLDIGINHSSTTASILVNQIEAPAINTYQIHPTTGLVTIKGSNFTGISAVKFGAAAALSFAVISENEITATSPEDIQGVITVTGSNGVASLSGFSNYRAPSITSFAPLTGVVGSTISITGKNFSPTIAENKVYFGTVAGVVTAATPNLLTVIVPTGASYSRLTVTTNSLKAVSSHYFNVSFGNGTAVFPSTDSFANSNTTLLTATTAITLSSVALSDLDGDGKTDLMVGKWDYLDFYSNTGDPTAPYTVRPNYSLTLEPNSNYHLADLDGDGKSDIVSSSKNAEEYKSNISFYKNVSTSSAVLFEKKVVVGPEIARGNNLVTGDFDGDGKEELVTYDYQSPIRIFRNIGTPGETSFDKVPMIIDHADPNIVGFDGVQVIDLDGDGKQDIVASYRSSVTGYGLLFFKNISENGTFAFIKQNAITGISLFNFNLADLNNDGLPDIVLSVNAASQNVKIFENKSENGTISFASGTSYTVGTSSSILLFGDLDGDGKPDMILTTTGNKIAILKNIGTGSTIVFSAHVELSIGDRVAKIAMADINNDGKLDLAIIDGSSTVGELKKTNIFFNVVKQPTLTKAEITVPGANITVKLSGTNLEGATKLTVAGVVVSTFSVISGTEIVAQFSAQLSGTVSVTTAYGTANLYGFSSKPVPLIQSFSPAKGPIGTEVTLTGLNFDPISTNNTVFFGAVRAEVTSASATTISVKVPTGANHLPISVATGGLIAYSKSPFIVTYENGASVFLKRNAFAPKYDIPTSEPLYIGMYVNSADLDGDGRPDLITTDKIFRNTSDPKRPFVATDFFKLPFSGRVIFADLDGDGKLDMASLGETTVRVHRNTSNVGNFSFESSKLFSVGQIASNIVAGDIDGDGKIDLITSNRQSNTVSVLRNISINNVLDFAPQQDYATGSDPTDLCVADFDNDGKLDIATSNFVTYNISVLKNNSVNGMISFGTRQDYSTNDATTSIVAGDLDGDGKVDLVTSSFQYFSGAREGATFKNLSTNGTILFSPKINYFQKSSEQHINAKLADMDGDGKPDLITADRSAEIVHLYPNISTSTTLAFGGQSTKTLIANQYAYDVVVGDWNLDGKPDLAVKNGSWISILLNQAGLTTPEITKLTPALGGENSTITLTGNFFDQATSVTFGGIEAKSFTVISANTIQAVVALNQGPVNPQEVTVTTPKGIALIEGFTYVRKPTITSYTVSGVAPNFTVVVNGFDLTGATAVSFGGIAVGSFVVNNTNKITVTSQVPIVGDLSVTTPGGNTIYKKEDVVPTISSLDTYTAATGEHVEITGTNFENVSKVTFGGVLAQSFNRVSGTKIIAVVGNGASGDVEVTTSTGTAKLAGFVYLSPPAITSFSPTTARLNETVIITGVNFANVTAVKFGNVAAASFTVVSPTSIQAIVGNGASGDVEVISSRGTAKLTGFSYLPPPEITSFSPTTAIANQLVTIKGTNFVNVIGVTFGDIAAASFNVVSPTTIEAIVANGSSGDIKITTLAGAVSKTGFIFSTKPTVTAVSTLVGGTGTQITISGINLSAITSVTFGGKAAGSFTILSATEISAVIADGASGEILVTNNKGEMASYQGFVFVPKPVISVIGSSTLINHATAVLKANTGKTFSYIWKKDGVTIAGKTTDEIEISQKGSYTVSIVKGTYTTVSEVVIIEAYFMLPADNFKIQSFGTSCIGTKNGSFTITALSPQSYQASIEGNGITKKQAFGTHLEVKELLPGSYNVCVTVDGQADFKQCFTIVISEPQNLAVYASLKATGDKLRLQLTGGTSYTIDLNGVLIQTNQGDIELPLKNGANTLKVTTDKLCQGTFDKTIFYTSSVSIYPNPFKEKLNIQFPLSSYGKVSVSIFDTQGKTAFRNDFYSIGSSIDLNLNGLNAGVYMLKITTENTETIHKIIKQ